MCVNINVIMTFLDFISKYKLVLIENMVIIDYQSNGSREFWTTIFGFNRKLILKKGEKKGGGSYSHPI